VIDITNPASPQVVGSVDTQSYPGDVAIFGNYAYVADGSGLQVIDITNPASPEIVGSVDTPSYAYGVAVSGTYVYVADWGSGLQILLAQCEDVVAIEDDPDTPGSDEETPSAGRHLTVHPNPFNPQTTVAFSLDRNVWAEIGVYDLTGRRVINLASRTFTAGPHTLTWNGRDSQGRAMPSGTYIVRLETESDLKARKVMLVR
jgi:hypothetical protein